MTKQHQLTKSVTLKASKSLRMLMTSTPSIFQQLLTPQKTKRHQLLVNGDRLGIWPTLLCEPLQTAAHLARLLPNLYLYQNPI